MFPHFAPCRNVREKDTDRGIFAFASTVIQQNMKVTRDTPYEIHHKKQGKVQQPHIFVQSSYFCATSVGQNAKNNMGNGRRLLCLILHQRWRLGWMWLAARRVLMGISGDAVSVAR